MDRSARNSIIKFLILFIFVVPSSTNYQLKTYNVGSGGGVNTSSSNFSGTFQAGEQGGANGTSTSYQINPGQIYTQQAYVPGQPTLTNPGNNYYNKLHFVIDAQNNPTDTKFAVAISSDNFVTTKYVQTDGSLSSSFVLSNDYQTYSQWGGSSGFNAIGLIANTAYKIKVKAMEGSFTETGFGPVSSSVSTVNPTITFTLSVNTDNFTGNLSTSAVTNTSGTTATVITNAATGYSIQVKSLNQGLKSPTAGNKVITSTNQSGITTLSNNSEGYVLAITSKTTNNAGTAAVVAKFDDTAANGAKGGDLHQGGFQEISYGNNTTTSDAYIFKERSTISGTTPAASDYSDILTVIASGNF